MKIRRADDRGKAKFGWLDSQHTFSFGHYFDSNHMGFGPLRVINDDRVDPAGGFSPHGHADMEIISYVVEGGLEHKDSIGNGSVIVPGDVQRMSAGTGIRHSEYNASKTSPVRFLQIWVIPDTQGIKPSYEQKRFFNDDENNTGMKLVGSRDGRGDSVTIHQDVDLYAARVNDSSESISFDLANNRKGWVQIVKGTIHLNGEELKEGDGASFENAETLHFSDANDAEFLFFDMAS